MQILDYYHDKLSILGVCLGHQAIGEFFGATLTKAQKPMHGKISKITITAESALFQDLPKSFNVVRYHSLVLQDLPDCLKTTALSQENEIMALKHKNLPIFGVQFHPEAALTDFGLQMIENWLKTLR